ncbi:MAG TPA: SdpI family protein [Candidatus Sulfotelmatobacter sp.]
MTTTQKYYLGEAAIVVAVFAGTLVAYPHLPETVPLHWDAHGQVNGWGPKWTLFIFGPGLIAFMVLLFSALPWLSPKKFEVNSFRGTYLYITITLVAMLAYIHLLVLAAALGVALDISRAIEGGICLLIALLGNVMGKVRRNFYIGVRTPWTLANEQVWNATHRFAAKTFVAGGVVGLLAVILRAPFWAPLSAILIAALVPAAYSLFFYKQLERQGNL